MKFGSIIVDVGEHNHTLYFSSGNIQHINNKSHKELAMMVKNYAIQGGKMTRKQYYDVYINGLQGTLNLKNELDDIGIESSFCKHEEYAKLFK